MAEKSPLLFRGMHGMGDCIHQRALLRQLGKKHTLYLETSWPSIYHDFPDMIFLRRPVGLRTQSKNAAREAAKFYGGFAPPRTPTMSVSYRAQDIMGCPSKTILELMCRQTGCDFATADFRLPIPTDWLPPAQAICAMNGSGKPLMVYRPLTVRPEWRGGGIRNANLSQYAELLAEVRDQFFIVSVADLVPGREWIVGPQLKADLALHDGLPFGTLAALFSLADVVYTSGGFGTLLAMAVKTPVVSVLGGFEPASWASAGARFSPYLGIEPKVPCACGRSGCAMPCTKELDLPLAAARLREFLSSICIQTPDTPRHSMAEMFDSPIRVSSLPLSHQQLQLQRAMLYSRASTGMRA